MTFRQNLEIGAHLVLVAFALGCGVVAISAPMILVVWLAS